MNALDLPATTLVIGAQHEGGTYVGRIAIDGALYGIVVAPRAAGEHKPIAWAGRSKAMIDGARSYCDGAANTAAMAKAGRGLGKWATALSIDGYRDWYLPSRDELELGYRALKPGTYTRDAWRCGDNPSSMPPGYPYTVDHGQTAVARFRAGGDDAFAEVWYWTSTQCAAAAECAWYQSFSTGDQYYAREINALRARAVRRFRI